MPYGNLITSRGMSEKERFQYRKRAKQGDFFEIEGAFGDSVWVPKSVDDLNPSEARKKNRLRLEWYQRTIDHIKKTKGKGYRKGLFTTIPSA